MTVQASGAGGISAFDFRALRRQDSGTAPLGGAADFAGAAGGAANSSGAAPAAPVSAGMPAGAIGQSGATSQTLFMAQLLGQDAEMAASSGTVDAPVTGADASTDEDGPSAAETAFLEFMAMTPAERYRAMFLGEEGLTEEELAAMSPEERAKIEARIQERIEMAMNDQMSEGVGNDAAAAADLAAGMQDAAMNAVAGDDAQDGTGGRQPMGFGDRSRFDELLRAATAA